MSCHFQLILKQTTQFSLQIFASAKSSSLNSLSSGTFVICAFISFMSLPQSHFIKEEFIDKLAPISPYAAHYLPTPYYFSSYIVPLTIYLLAYSFFFSVVPSGTWGVCVTCLWKDLKNTKCHGCHAMENGYCGRRLPISALFVEWMNQPKKELIS